jgi:hypothetical protein
VGEFQKRQRLIVPQAGKGDASLRVDENILNKLYHALVKSP